MLLMQNALHHSFRVLYMKSLSIIMNNKMRKTAFCVCGVFAYHERSLGFHPQHHVSWA